MVLERAKGIEPSYAAWEAAVLPLNYARTLFDLAETGPSAKIKLRRLGNCAEAGYGCGFNQPTELSDLSPRHPRPPCTIVH